MNTIREIRQIATSTVNSALEQARSNNLSICGYFCSYVPEEIIHAAGLIPYRMRAVESTGTTKGDIYFSSLNCTFVRRCFDKLLGGDFSFLDGLVCTNGCDHIRRIYDNWRDVLRHHQSKPDFLHMLIIPHVLNCTAQTMFQDELMKLITALEQRFNVEVTPQKLRRSIGLFNEKRRLLQELSERRKADPFSISGSEMFSLSFALTALPVENAISLLKSISGQIKEKKPLSPGPVRLLLLSGCLEEIEHIEMIEAFGAVVVADYLCHGSRQSVDVVQTDCDPLTALARRYLYHPSCPRMINDYNRRMQNIFQIASDHKVDAIIGEKLKFCDLWGGELFLLKKECQRHNIPLLLLERELYGGDTGQLQTRIQAFLEQVGHNKARRV